MEKGKLKRILKIYYSSTLFYSFTYRITYMTSHICQIVTVFHGIDIYIRHKNKRWELLPPFVIPKNFLSDQNSIILLLQHFRIILARFHHCINDGIIIGLGLDIAIKYTVIVAVTVIKQVPIHQTENIHH